MALKERVFVDKTEIVAGIVMGNSATRISIKAEDIAEVSISAMPVKKLFKTQMKEMIAFKMKKSPMPTVIMQEKSDAKYWDGYKSQIEKFCEKNRIKFMDMTKMPAPEAPVQ